MPAAGQPWRELLSNRDEDPDDVLEIIEILTDADAEALPASLGGLAEGVIDLVVRRGPGEVVDLLVRPLVPLYQRALEAAGRSSPVGMLGAVTTGGLLAATDHGQDPGRVLGQLLDALLRRRGDLNDQERTSLGLACAALGFDETVPQVIGDRDGGAFEPGRDFGASAQGYARYLVAAAVAGATTDDFRAAWASFVAYFPLRLETGGLSWGDLLWAGYGAYTRIFGYEPGEVAQGLHEYVLEFAEL
jgi:hypothetical protein